MANVITKRKGRTLRQELDELLSKKRDVRKTPKWEAFFGKVQFAEDPVAYQRNLRDE